MTTEFLETARLQPGQALRMAVDKGFALVAVQGAVSIVSSPSWFGETVFTARSTLSEGEAYVAEHGGWIEVLALSSAQVRGSPRIATAAPAASRIARRMQLFVASTVQRWRLLRQSLPWPA